MQHKDAKHFITTKLYEIIPQFGYSFLDEEQKAY